MKHYSFDKQAPKPSIGQCLSALLAGNSLGCLDKDGRIDLTSIIEYRPSTNTSPERLTEYGIQIDFEELLRLVKKDKYYILKEVDWECIVNNGTPILCWVWSERMASKRLAKVISYIRQYQYPYRTSDSCAYTNAEPVTVEDLKKNLLEFQ